MKERWIRISIIALLVVLNVFLLVMYLEMKYQDRYVPEEAISRIEELYHREGISFEVPIPRTNPSFSELRLTGAEVDKLTEAFLGGQEYDKSYIYGSKIQYDAGEVQIISDQRQHSATYENEAIDSPYTEREGEILVVTDGAEEVIDLEQERELVQSVARYFASRWLGSDLYLDSVSFTADGFVFTYDQMAKDQIYFFNHITITASRRGVSSASLVYWDISGTGEELSVLSADEILMVQLRQIKEAAPAESPETHEGEMEEQGARRVTSLMNGYSIVSIEGGSALARPLQQLILDDGSAYRAGYAP